MSQRRHLSQCAGAVVVVLLLGAIPATAQDPAPRTTWGQPVLQGVWDFRSITPMQRPEDLAEKEFLTAEEAAEFEQNAVDRDVRLWNQGARRTEAGESVGGYNNFWMDRGLKAVGTRRTSLIVYPPNGRMPALTPAGQERAAGPGAPDAPRRHRPQPRRYGRPAGDRAIW